MATCARQQHRSDLVDMRAGWAVLCLCIAMVSGCVPASATELVVRVDTDAPVAEIVTVDLRVEETADGGRVRFERTYDIAGGQFSFPGEVGLVARSPNDSTTVSVQVVARLTGGREISRRAVVSFRPRRILVFEIFLAARCLDPAHRLCPDGTTCGLNGCEAIVPIVVEFNPDAGRDASRRDVTVAFDGASDARVDVARDVPVDAPSPLDVRAEACARNCAGRACGPDSCGGSCGFCPGALVCNAGRCACGPGQTACGPLCVVTDSDPLHCGACNSACPTNSACVGGACRCEAGRTLCLTPLGLVCVDTMTDAEHCGSCAPCTTTLPGITSGRCNAGVCEVVTCDYLHSDCSLSLPGCEAVVGTNDSCGNCVNRQTCLFPTYCVQRIESDRTPGFDCCEFAMGCTTSSGACGGARPVCFRTPAGLEYCCPT